QRWALLKLNAKCKQLFDNKFINKINRMKKTRLLGFLNTIITGSVTFFSWFVFSSAFKENDSCEFCSIMLFPATIFSLLLLPGIYTLLASKINLVSHKILLNTTNLVAI